MTRLPKYKAIPNDNSTIVFFPNSMDIITMKNEDYNNATEEQLVECADNFFETFKNSQYYIEAYVPKKRFKISKLMLDVTDDCNLDCGYCYASKYYKKENMSNETIEKIITKFFLPDIVEGVNQVVFFGGEPLLNLSGIEYFIKRLEELLDEGKIEYLPRFNIITNGTIYSERVFNLFNKYKMGVMVSCDGPAELQDAQRPFRGSGKGSFDVVAGNLKKMAADGLTPAAEVTVTKFGIEKGYTHSKMRRFFLEELGVRSIACVPETKTAQETMKDFYDKFYEDANLYYKALIDLDYRNEMFDIPFRLVTKRPLKYPCAMARGAFHFLANGDVCPCQLLGGMEEYKLSSIDDFNDSLFYNNSWIEKYDANSTKCNSCWAKPMCKFCSARNLLEINSYIPPEKKCVQTRDGLEDLIRRVVKFRQDPTEWNDFTERLRVVTSKIEEEQGLDR